MENIYNLGLISESLEILYNHWIKSRITFLKNAKICFLVTFNMLNILSNLEFHLLYIALALTVTCTCNLKAVVANIMLLVVIRIYKISSL